MAESAIAVVKFDPADMTDPANPLARYHTEGKIAAAQEQMTEAAFHHMLTEGKIAAAMASMEAREAAAKQAEQEAYHFNQMNKLKAVVHGQMNPVPFIDPPK